MGRQQLSWHMVSCGPFEEYEKDMSKASSLQKGFGSTMGFERTPKRHPETLHIRLQVSQLLQCCRVCFSVPEPPSVPQQEITSRINQSKRTVSIVGLQHSIYFLLVATIFIAIAKYW